MRVILLFLGFLNIVTSISLWNPFWIKPSYKTSLCRYLTKYPVHRKVSTCHHRNLSESQLFLLLPITMETHSRRPPRDPPLESSLLYHSPPWGSHLFGDLILRKLLPKDLQKQNFFLGISSLTCRPRSVPREHFRINLPRFFPRSTSHRI